MCTFKLHLTRGTFHGMPREVSSIYFCDFLVEILITICVYTFYCRLFPVTRNQEVFLEDKGRGLI